MYSGDKNNFVFKKKQRTADEAGPPPQFLSSRRTFRACLPIMQ